MNFIRHRFFLYTASLLIIILTIVGLCNAIVLWHAKPFLKSDTSQLSQAEAVIVLGAAVYNDDSLTPVFKERVDFAIEIYQAGLVEKILVSGDNGTYTYNEVSPAHLYLTQQGIPAEDIFLDYAGFDTYDTMYRARAVFAVESAIVSTQSFHLPRALFIADALGLQVEGVSQAQAKNSFYLSLRESLARVKAVFDVRLGSRPEYLGEVIPITGDGRESVGE